jgi:hypothetical protein
VAGRIRSIRKSNFHIGNRASHLTVCSMVPQATTLQRAPSPVHVYLSVALQPFWIFASFQFLGLYTVGRTPWMGDLPVTRTTKIQNKRTHTSMPSVGFKPTIRMFERPKIIPALDHAASVIGSCSCICIRY